MKQKNGCLIKNLIMLTNYTKKRNTMFTELYTTKQHKRKEKFYNTAYAFE